MAEGKLEDAKESRAFEISQLQNVITMLKSNNWVNGSHIDLVRFVNQQTHRGGSILPGMFHLAWHMLFHIEKHTLSPMILWLFNIAIWKKIMNTSPFIDDQKEEDCPFIDDQNVDIVDLLLELYSDFPGETLP